MAICLSVAVPLRIMEFEERGGPTDAERKELAEGAHILAERGDILQFGGGKPGEVADLFNRLAREIAMLAYCPGGVTTFGMTFAAGALNPKLLLGVPAERV